MATKDIFDDPKPTPTPKLNPGLKVGPGPLYKGTDKTAEQLGEAFGYEPDGTPRTEPAPTGPACSPVNSSEGPFDTTAIPAGCSEPLSQECADYYNKQYGYDVAKASPPPAPVVKEKDKDFGGHKPTQLPAK